MTCPHVPPPLRQFLKMRPEALGPRSGLLARTLVQYPNHEMTEGARRMCLEAEPGVSSIVEAIESGEIFTTSGLRKTLGEDPQRNAQWLGTTLWARGLESPSERAFFELLLLIAHEPPEQPESEAAE